MPGHMSGRELADEVARRYPTTKILFTSGATEKLEFDGASVPTGANLLTKPYYRQDLAIRIREILDALSRRAFPQRPRRNTLGFPQAGCRGILIRKRRAKNVVVRSGRFMPSVR